MQTLKAEYFEAKEKSVRFRNNDKELAGTEEGNPSLQNENEELPGLPEMSEWTIMGRPICTEMPNFLNLSNAPVKKLKKVEEFSSEIKKTKVALCDTIMGHLVENFTSNEDNESREAETSNLDDPTSPPLNQNSNFANETYVDSTDNHIVETKRARAVNGNSEDEMLDAKPDQELTEDEVHIYNEISLKDNDGQMSDKENEATLDKVENFAVDMKNNSKVILENPNESMEPEGKRNVVKLLFEGTFLENSTEIF